MMLKGIGLASVLLFLGGCGTVEDLYNYTFTKGAEFYDGALQKAVDIKCKASSAGSVQRRYMQTPGTWKLWTDECLRTGGKTIPELPTEE